MIKVVLDTNTVVSAIFWPQSVARRCLAGLARRQYALAATDDVLSNMKQSFANLLRAFQNGTRWVFSPGSG